MKILISCFILATFLSSVLGIKYTDCGSSDGTLVSAEVAGCENVDVCPLKRGTDVSLTLKFSSKSNTKSLKAVVHGIIAGVPMPFPVPQPNACLSSGVACPLKSGENYVYTTTLTVRNSYPPLHVDVKWELKDDSGADVICVKIPAKVV